MNYRLLLICLLSIGAIATLSFIAETIQIISNAKPVTVYPVRMRFAGASGVVRTCYIESDTITTYGKLIAKRDYSGLSISKLLVPESAINRLRKVTFYSNRHQLQLAATDGDMPAGKLRLYLDTLSYQIGRYLFVIMAYIFLLAFSAELYKRIFHKTLNDAEVAQLVNQTRLGKAYFYACVGLLILIVIA